MNYTQTYTYGGQTFTIIVGMRTGTIQQGDIEIPVNKITVQHYDGTTTFDQDITDDKVVDRILSLVQAEQALIDGVDNPELDEALLGLGFTRS